MIATTSPPRRHENEAASRLEAIFARALRVQLSDVEQDAARAQLEADALKCRCLAL